MFQDESNNCFFIYLLITRIRQQLVLLFIGKIPSATLARKLFIVTLTFKSEWQNRTENRRPHTTDLEPRAIDPARVSALDKEKAVRRVRVGRFHWREYFNNMKMFSSRTIRCENFKGKLSKLFLRRIKSFDQRGGKVFDWKQLRCEFSYRQILHWEKSYHKYELRNTRSEHYFLSQSRIDVTAIRFLINKGKSRCTMRSSKNISLETKAEIRRRDVAPYKK